MKLSLAKTEDRAPSYDEESNIFQPLALQIVTPEGTTITMQVTTGDTISIIKKRLEVEHSISYKGTVLTLNDKVMIEPLSLNDFADLPAVDPVIVCKQDDDTTRLTLTLACLLVPTTGNNPIFLNVG